MPTLRILVVDDDISMRSVIKDHLSSAYEVFDTGASETALALIFEHKPDAILLDLSMPGLSGFELCRVLSSLPVTRKIPIFIVSGEDERNRAFCKNLGAARYFSKPIDFTKLKTDLSFVLNSTQAERRADPRFQLRLMLKLRITKQDGASFEARGETENISKGGFLCTCTSCLEEGATVEVFLRGENDYNLGNARVVRIVETGSASPRYGFQFIGKTALL
ncbi:MAG TPA: response regulator [Candidatus Acidoferrales bacterium]|jgi:twitching motility two-component system response regulator PilG|nr:response regulator [Candidatus Acidoferrales bacterium]